MFRRKRRRPPPSPTKEAAAPEPQLTGDQAAVADQHVFSSPLPAQPTPTLKALTPKQQLAAPTSTPQAPLVRAAAASEASPAAAVAAQQLEQQQQQDQDQPEVVEEALEPLQQQDEPEEQEQLPESFTMPADELLYSVQWALTSELHKTRKLTPEQVISATESITESFRAALQTQAANTGTVAGAAAAEGAAAAVGDVGAVGEGDRGSQQTPALLAPASYTVLPYQLAKLKKALVEKRDK